jgi:hypothetical protein
VEEVEEVAIASWHLAEYLFSLIKNLARVAGSNRELAMAKGRP